MSRRKIEQEPPFPFSNEEMLEINDEGLELCHECPQFRGDSPFKDRDILRGKVDPETFIERWTGRNSPYADTLFDSGYIERSEPGSIFNDFLERVKVWKAEKIIWKYKNKKTSNSNHN